ncbi:DinB family protein [Rhodococcus chondri]|uniref:DinB family protein n=1 Tax=Rhodococcus chondri TaxID=3065941 RepID=A0ABU7JKK8_9NOCA|nr:DinB family protein [Rhodococcus sp. CC-R104]MEE2030574.1 DinB family protein [Rhodococcus sp. CC-R104]
MSQNTATGERADILAMLAEQREMLLITVRGLDEQGARARSTVSDLTLGGLIKHVSNTEKHWIETIRNLDDTTTFDMDAAMEQYYMRDDETLAGLLERYEATVKDTEEFVARLDDLDLQVPLPTAPWAPEREWWSARKVLLHIIRETAHHSGHADIIRESLDGANATMQRGADAGMEFD